MHECVYPILERISKRTAEMSILYARELKIQRALASTVAYISVWQLQRMAVASNIVCVVG